MSEAGSIAWNVAQIRELLRAYEKKLPAVAVGALEGYLNNIVRALRREGLS
jgi:hypothetical protein